MVQPDEWNSPITEDWLRANGFKWHEFDRQGTKHWLLWLGSLIAERERELRPGPWAGAFMGSEDLGIVVAPVDLKDDRRGWFCWLRADISHRYSRFVHIKYVYSRLELVRLIEGVTGVIWKPGNNFYGCMHTDAVAAKIREEDERRDRRMLRENPKWREIEKDDTRGQALPEHMEVAEGFEPRKGEERR